MPHATPTVATAQFSTPPPTLRREAATPSIPMVLGTPPTVPVATQVTTPPTVPIPPSKPPTVSIVPPLPQGVSDMLLLCMCSSPLSLLPSMLAAAVADCCVFPATCSRYNGQPNWGGQRAPHQQQQQLQHWRAQHNPQQQPTATAAISTAPLPRCPVQCPCPPTCTDEQSQAIS